MALRSINLYNTFQSNEHKSMEYQGLCLHLHYFYQG